MNDAGVAPPGVIPIQQPISVDRIEVAQYRGSCLQVSSTTRALILALPPLNDMPSSIVSRISPSPNSPITAVRKSKPLSSDVEPKVIRNWPVTLSRPTDASAEPSTIAASVLKPGDFVMPMKLANVRNCTPKNSAGPNLSANFATSGARKVIISTAKNAPTNDDVNAAVSASPARPFCASG